jgi:uroporphyrin-III C-methyltransferase
MADSTAPAPHIHRVTLTVAVLAALLTGYALWRVDALRDRADIVRDRVLQLETTNASLRAEVAAAVERESRARAELQAQWQPRLAQLSELPQQVKDLTAAHEDLRARTERPQRTWSRAEALYLIDLAQRRLSFDRDVDTALAALQAADARLASLRDASLDAVRARIAQDVQALRAVPVPDTGGALARLSAIAGQIDRLPLKGMLAGQRTPVDQPLAQSVWDRAWASVGNAFKTLFSVRRIDANQGAVVGLEEQALRRQHLTLLVFTVRSAMQRHDRASYRAGLNDMQAWLAQYFSESATALLQQELAALADIDIAPVLPDVSTAARMLARALPP